MLRYSVTIPSEKQTWKEWKNLDKENFICPFFTEVKLRHIMSKYDNKMYTSSKIQRPTHFENGRFKDN